MKSDTPLTEQLMSLVDDYADQFHDAMRSDGGINFAGGYVAKVQKDKVRDFARRLEQCAAQMADALDFPTNLAIREALAAWEALRK